MKKTFIGCSLNGQSAFEVVDRGIQKRELYIAGERGEYWLSSHFSYENSSTQIKMKGQLSMKSLGLSKVTLEVEIMIKFISIHC